MAITKEHRKQYIIQWRRDKVLELTSQGYSQRDSKITTSWEWNDC
jgi:hypothetical protein